MHPNKVAQIIEKRNLYQVMDDTNWRALQMAMLTEMPFPPPYILKKIDERLFELRNNYQDNIHHYGDWSEKALCRGEYHWIESIEIIPIFQRQIDNDVVMQMVDATEILVNILKKNQIPFEKEENRICIYGYKCKL